MNEVVVVELRRDVQAGGICIHLDLECIRLFMCLIGMYTTAYVHDWDGPTVKPPPNGLTAVGSVICVWPNWIYSAILA